MGKPIAPDPSINSEDDYSEMLEAFKAFSDAVPPEPVAEAVAPKTSDTAPSVAPVSGPAPTLDTAGPVHGPPRAPEPVSLPDEAGADSFKSPHADRGWIDWAQGHVDRAVAGINPPEARKEIEARIEKREEQDHDVAVWRKAAEDEAKRVAAQLSVDAGNVPISMVEIGDRYGLNISEVRQSLIHDALRKRSADEYPGHTWANVETGMRAAGVDPDAEKKKWAAEATKSADTRIKMAFAGKKHLTAISVDNEGLEKELLGYSQVPISERFSVSAGPVPIARVPVPWSTAELMAIVAPKEFTVSVPGGVNSQLTPAEIKGEEWGDHVPRVAFDLVQAAMAARYKTFMKEGGKDILPTAAGTITSDGNLGEKFPELRKYAPLNPIWQLPMFAKSVNDGDVKRAFEIYVDASAGANGQGRTEDEKLEYVRLLRTNPAFRDILQKEWVSFFDETWDSLYGKPMPDALRMAVSVGGYANGMVLGDFVIPDPVGITTAGTSEVISAGRHAYKTRQADTIVAATEKMIQDPAVSPDMLRDAITKIDPAFADHQMDTVKIAARAEAGATVGVKTLEHKAQVLLDEAAVLRKEAGEAPIKAAEATKKASDEAKQAVADTEWAAGDKAAKLKSAHGDSVKAMKLAEADRKIAEAADLLEKTELIRTEQAAKDARKALEDYAANNDPIKARVVKAYKEADALDKQYTAARTAAKEFGDANVPVLEQVVPVMLEADKRYGDVLKHGSDLGDATIEAGKAQTKLQEAIEQMEKARTNVRAPAKPKELARLRAEVKKAAEAVQTANVKVADIKKALDEAKKATVAAQKAAKALPPEHQAVWKKLMALEDKASDTFSRAASYRDTLVRTFGDDIPDTLVDADKAMRQQLVGAYDRAKSAYQAQVTKAGGTSKALAKALQGKKQAEAALETVRQARQAHAAATAARVKAVAAKGAHRVGEVAQKGVTKTEKAVGRAEDVAQTAALRSEEAQSWKQAALDTAKRYRDGLRMSKGIQQATGQTRTTKELITQGLLKETSNKAGFLVDVPKLLARLEESIGAGGVKWLSEQDTDTGLAVKKLTEAIGGLQLSPQEVRALEQGIESYNTARVMGHTQKEALLTYNTVKGLQAIEHTKQGASWHKKVIGTVARWMRAFDNNAILLGSVEDTLPGIARAATNKSAQAKDELAFLKTRGKWEHTSEYGRKAVQGLGINADANAEGATHAALIFEYLGTTRALTYAPGGTLLNTSTITGKSLFEQFRMHALADARVTEFLARAQKAKTADELDALAMEFSDSVAPYLLGVSRAWFPTTPEKVNPKTAIGIMQSMMDMLRRSAENGDDLPEFVAALRKRTEAAPVVGTTSIKNGEEVSGVLRPHSMSGLGSSDKDVVRVMGFLGDLIAHGSNLFETERLLTKAIGGVVDADTIKHVDAFIAGNFSGVDGKPIDVAKVMAFFNRVGLPMSSDRFKTKDWLGNYGDRVVRLQALQNDPKVAAWVTADLVKSLDADLGKVVKTLEGRTRYDGVPDMGTGARLVNLWRRSVTVGLLGPKPAFWVGNYLGNITQTWTTLGVGKAGQVAVNDAWTNVPFVGKWGQDFMSRQAMKARGTPVLGPVMDWFFNPHIAAVMNGDNGWVRLKNGAVIDYATLRREAIEYGVVDTMLREDLSTVFARKSQQGMLAKVSKVLWAETDFHRSMSDFQTMTQQRSRMSLYLRLRDEGHSAGEAGKLLNDALFDWKHGAPAIGALMQLLPFWRFFALGHRQAFRAEMQGFYDTKGALRGAFGDSQMGRLRQQRAVVTAIEDTFLPDQQGPYASEEEQRMAMAANLDPAWNHDKVRFSMSELPQSVSRQIMEDSGQVKTHAMYHLWKPTTLAFMDTHFAFIGAATAQLYAGAYGDSVESRGMGAFGEAASSVVDDTVPWLADPIHQVLNSAGLDPEDGSSAQSVAASNGQAQLIKTLCKTMGWDERAFVWQPRGANGEYRMTPQAAIFAQLPYMNDIIPHHARIALSPYRMEKDERAVKMVTHGMAQMMGLGPVFFSPEKTVDWTRRDIKENIGKLVPPGAKPQFQGRVKVEEPPKGEVDK